MLFYADPDITFLAPWKFFQDWANLGIALVEDSNFPRVQPNHPWRAVWKNLLSVAGLEADSVKSDSYANSGFFGISRRDRDFLKIWAEVTLAYEASGKIDHEFSDGQSVGGSRRGPGFAGCRYAVGSAESAALDMLVHVRPAVGNSPGFRFLMCQTPGRIECDSA